MTTEELRAMVAQPQYGFLRKDEHLGERIIFLTLGGSYAYGTNVEGSDLDIRGCALNSRSDNPLAMYLTDIATISSNLVGAPALSMPVGFDKNNMPIGLQIIAKNLDELTLLQSAYALEQDLNIYNQRPNI